MAVGGNRRVIGETLSSDDHEEGGVERRDDSGVGAPPELDERVRAQLGRQLRTYYSSLVDEPVPDKILDLLKRLSETEGHK